MTIKQKIDHALSLTPAPLGGDLPSPHSVTVDLPPDATLTLSLSGVEAWGCLLDRFELFTPRLANVGGDRLKVIGQALAQRLTYLLEPIRLIETDGQGGVAQLRSQPPQKDDAGAAYYELFVRRGGSITLERYQRLKGESRRRVGAQLTREVLQRIAADALAAVA